MTSPTLKKDYEKQDTPEWVMKSNHYHDVNPYLHGVMAPTFKETTEGYLTVIEGKVPTDLTGIYVRNGANPRFESRGPHHWFDGDGMLHALTIKDGNASYKNRWVRTKHFNMESEAGEAIWPGYAMPRPVPKTPKGAGTDFAIKDASNTDVIWYNGALITSFYQTGVPYRVNPVTLETEGQETFNSYLPRQVSAHCKVDDATGELMFFDYNLEVPYMTYGVANSNGNLTNFVEIPLPGPRLPHDMAISENYSILMDLPLYWKKDQYALQFFKDETSRFAVIPRHGSAEDIRWFDAKPCYIYHTVNAYEEGDYLIMDGCRQKDPLIPRQPGDTVIDRMAAAGTWKDVKLYRWKFNLKTGKTQEYQLDDTNVEFPMANVDDYIGKKYSYAYATIMPNNSLINFSGVYKLNVDTGEKQVHYYPEGTCGAETPFAPADNATSEDHGYLITYLTDNDTGKSEAQIFDAKKIEQGPICRLHIPCRVPAGFHSCWVNGKKAFKL
jgi:carotenoid cleavage dioxygenase-like enzyme